MEVLDHPRIVGGSDDQILRDLEWLGLDWDGEVVYQSKRNDLYQAALSKLQDKGLVYECFCSRKDIQQAVSAPHGNSPAYPGTCAELDNETVALQRQKKAPAIRVRVGKQQMSFQDGCVGEVRERLAETSGDFVIRRADGLFAYQLAVIVDDLEQVVSDVVRGADLVDSTIRQIYLAEQLAPQSKQKPTIPNYWHVPLMLDEQGQRMAKRDGSQSVQDWKSGGRTSSQLIGLLAHSAGLLEAPEPISSAELLAELSFEKLDAALKDTSNKESVN